MIQTALVVSAPNSPVKPKLTQERLREVLDYDPEIGIFTNRIQRSARSTVGAVAGSVDTESGYRRIHIDGEKFKAQRLAWFHHYGEWPTAFVDHINCDTDDNRIQNLRLASNAENMLNCNISSRNTSGVKGVCWDKRRGMWIAQISINGVQTKLGRFSDIDDAASAVRKAREKFHGEFSNHG